MNKKKNIQVTIPYFDEKEAEKIREVIATGWVAQGKMVAEFEQKVAKHENNRYGVATTSCTTALHLAMVASGLERENEVFVPAFTFVATANSVIEAGAIPVLIDIKKETFNINIEEIEHKIELEYEFLNNQLISKKTGNKLWGIVPVHQFGLCCEINKINDIARKYHLNVIEDAACALGAKINKEQLGNGGNPVCLSFHPRKSITTGEGGMVLTNDKKLEKKMKELRSHGSTVSADSRHINKGYLLPEFSEAGYNYRMTDIQAAMGVVQMDKLDFIIQEKRKRAKFYNNEIKQKIPELIIPTEPMGYMHTYQSYVCMLDWNLINIDSVYEAGIFRNQLLERLEKEGIATRQGTHAVHMLDYYKNNFGYLPEMFENAFQCDRLSITLPLFVQMTQEDQEYVIEKIREILDRMLEL